MGKTDIAHTFGNFRDCSYNFCIIITRVLFMSFAMQNPRKHFIVGCVLNSVAIERKFYKLYLSTLM